MNDRKKLVVFLQPTCLNPKLCFQEQSRADLTAISEVAHLHRQPVPESYLDVKHTPPDTSVGNMKTWRNSHEQTRLKIVHMYLTGRAVLLL